LAEIMPSFKTTLINRRHVYCNPCRELYESVSFLTTNSAVFGHRCHAVPSNDKGFCSCEYGIDNVVNYFIIGSERYVSLPPSVRRTWYKNASQTPSPTDDTWYYCQVTIL
jgi:hypothetical protein